MKEHVICADVYTQWNRWSTEPAPRYRIYVDQEMVTERDFTWNGNEYYIRETIPARLPPGTHRVRLEVVSGCDAIEITRVTVDSQDTSPEFVT
jgi:hypothetical protein